MRRATVEMLWFERGTRPAIHELRQFNIDHFTIDKHLRFSSLPEICDLPQSLLHSGNYLECVQVRIQALFGELRDELGEDLPKGQAIVGLRLGRLGILDGLRSLRGLANGATLA
jgi:hypothetical protein